MKKPHGGFLFFSAVSFLVVAVMMAVEFFPACDQGRGTDLLCEFGTGMVAKIEGPARIHIFSEDKFTIGYFSDGVLKTETSIHTSIFHNLTFTTSDSIDLYMLKSTNRVILPLIRVDAINGQQYPSLIVSRTIQHPLTQLFQWSLFPVMLNPLALGLVFFYWSFRKEKTK
jgi:hypothetical protein